jgi:transketolase
MSRSDALANAIRVLSMDAVEQANSGHPGAPMGMADMADRAVAQPSAVTIRANRSLGRIATASCFRMATASMLLYSLLHLSGYDVTISDDLQPVSPAATPRLPAIPEYGSTVPALRRPPVRWDRVWRTRWAWRWRRKLLAAAVQPARTSTWSTTAPGCFVGDGCLMEGISHEACSLAGTLGLGKLTAFLR